MVQDPVISIKLMRQGSVNVEAISGLVETNRFILYLTLDQNNTKAEVVCENPAIVIIYPPEWSSVPTTTIELPSNWSVEASVCKYTCRIVGVLTPAVEDLVSLQFTTRE